MEDFIQNVHDLAQSDWLLTLVVGLVILGLTFVVSLAASRIVKRFLKRNSKLPANSIFLNLVRVLIWVCGIGLLLSVCFDVDVSGLITALGVGGIALSLGFQDTLSNLIGGLEVSLSRLIQPGDRIQVNNGVIGVVQDVAWRQTTIIDGNGNTIYIPNSYISTYAVSKLAPSGDISIPIVVNTTTKRLTVVAHEMEKAAKDAVGRFCKIKDGPNIKFTSIGDFGFNGVLRIVIADNDRVKDATDAAIRAIAPYAHANSITDVANSVGEIAREESKLLKDARSAKASSAT